MDTSNIKPGDMENGIHDKTEFQVERIAFFSDAVFAIAITLLIIEIKVPELHEQEITDKALLHGLLATIPKMIGFIVSFFVISLYWMSHHRLFRYIVTYNQKFLWRNILFLLFIVIMPFSTAVYSEYSRPTLHTPLILYSVNICCCGLYSYLLWRTAANPKYHLSQGITHAVEKYNRVRALMVPALFLLVALVSFINPVIAYFIPPFLPFATQIVKRRYHKKYPELVNG